MSVNEPARSVEERTVLITGAAGFVGRRVGEVLAARGWRVTGLDRAAPAAVASPSPWTDFWECDLLDEAALARRGATWSFAAVVHLAGILPSAASRRDLFAVNVGGTAAVLDRCAQARCQLVFFSTGLVYGAQPGPFVESMECLPAEPYGQSKLAAEALVRAWSLRTRSLSVVLRPGVLYGRGAPASMFLVSLMNALAKREPFAMTPGEQRRDFLHVDDAAQAVAAVLDGGVAGTWNLASGEAWTVREAAELGAAIAGRPELLRVGALPYRANEVFDYRLDVRALEQATGWRPSLSLRAGLTRLWKEAT